MLNHLVLFADASSAAASLKTAIVPLLAAFGSLAFFVCLAALVTGGYFLMTSGGHPSKVEKGKRIIRNAIIGCVVVLGATGLVSIMQNAYSTKTAQPQQLPSVSVEQPKDEGVGPIVNAAVSAFLQGAIASVGKSVIELIKQFTTATPMMASNNSVFNLWVVIVAIADVLFLLVVGLIGFRIMGASVIGLEDVDLGSLVPQVATGFVIANFSIFAIDAIIGLSNAMIQALLMGMSNDIIWVSLVTLLAGVANMTNIGILFIYSAIVILGIMLLVYYLQRMIVLYVGAVLSPLVILLWLLPSFRDFATAAMKTYIITIFVLFVQVVILMLAVSLFSGLVKGDGNPFITALLGIATLLALLKTGHTMTQIALMSSGSYGLRRLGNTFVRSVSHMSSTIQKNKGGVGVERIPATEGGGNTGGASSMILGNAGSGKFAQNQGTPSQKLMTGEARRAEPISNSALTKKQLPLDRKVIDRQAAKLITKENLKGMKK